MIATILVLGQSASVRELAIARHLADAQSLRRTAVLLEGLADGKPTLQSGQSLTVVRIAPGCLCCSNNMIMKVHLNRLIRETPDQLYISLSDATHLDRIQAALSADGYEKVLTLTDSLAL